MDKLVEVYVAGDITLAYLIKAHLEDAGIAVHIANENVSAADSVIRETDFATETASLTRNQILVNASTSVLSVANSMPQTVLALIG